jgi:hypothetical protein
MTEENLNNGENTENNPVQGNNINPVPENKPEEKIQDEHIKLNPEPAENSFPVFPKESNYQVSLINENLLRIKVTTNKSVNINCSVKDKSSTLDSQTNKIHVRPKTDTEPQEIEIVISIDPDTGEIVVEKKKTRP